MSRYIIFIFKTFCEKEYFNRYTLKSSSFNSIWLAFRQMNDVLRISEDR